MMFVSPGVHPKAFTKSVLRGGGVVVVVVVVLLLLKPILYMFNSSE